MEVGILVAFVAGFLTFFATCLIPVLPAYIAYLGGTAFSSDGSSVPTTKGKVFGHSLLFVAGFILVFMILGLAATHVGNAFASYRPMLEKIGGVFLIVIGIYMLEIIKLPILFKSFQFQPSQRLRATKLGAFIFGLSFGFAWSPCIGPVLATILFISSQVSMAYGTLLLLVFGAGLAIPFLIVGLLFDSIGRHLRKFTRSATVVRSIAAMIIIIVGILMLTGHLGLLSKWWLEYGASPVLEFEGF